MFFAFKFRRENHRPYIYYGLQSWHQVFPDYNSEVQQRKKEFNEKFFGIRDKDEIKKELRDANSVDGQVNNLKQRIDGMNNHTGGFR